jgi:hypothetical protein
MSTGLTYRAASVLLLIYAAAHQLGFRQVDPKWNADATVAAMRATTFVVQGQTRSYWDFFSGFGFFCTGLLLFAAVLAWQLGGLAGSVLQTLKVARWAFAGCFVVLTVLTWRYFFPAPTIFSALVSVALVLGALS